MHFKRGEWESGEEGKFLWHNSEMYAAWWLPLPTSILASSQFLSQLIHLHLSAS